MMATRRQLVVGLAVLCALGVSLTSYSSSDGTRTLLVEAVRPGLDLTVDRDCGGTYRIGETLDVRVTSRLDGYLTLYDFTTDGLVHQIYPNEYYSDNLIEAGIEYRIPGNLLPFVFRVAPPEGQEILFAVVTSRPVTILPDEFFDYSQAFPQIMLDEEEAATEMSNSLGIIPGNVRSAVAVCHFEVVQPEEEPSFDFSVSARPASATVKQAESVSTTIQGWKTEGPDTRVDFSLTGLPSGVTPSVSEWTWTLGDESRVVRFSADSDAPAGTYHVTIRATSGSLARSCTFTLTVEERAQTFDFSVSANPTSATVTQKGSASATIRGWRTAGPDTQVDFSLTGLPSGVTPSVSEWTWTLGDESRVVRFSADSDAPAGTYDATIRATNGSLVRSCTFTLTVEERTQAFDFSVSANPPSATVKQEGSTSTTIRGWRTAGPDTQVDFSITGLPDGVTPSVSEWTWTLGDESRVVRFSVDSDAPVGSHRITIQGTGGQATGSATFMLRVEAEEAQKEAGEVYALFVAISDYKGETDADFSCPVMQDTAQLIQDTLRDYFDHTKQLDDEEATRSKILDAIRDFLGQAGTNDTAYFHFAGHGLQVDDENGDEADGKDEVIAPYDFQWILDDEIWELVSELDAGTAVLVFESCHSGTAYRGLFSSLVYSPPEGTRDVGPGGTMVDDLHAGSRSPSGPSLLALQAASATESAWGRCRIDGTSGVTFFAEALAQAFSEKQGETDSNGDGWLSFQEAFERAKVHLEDSIGDSITAGVLPEGTVQTPEMYDGVGEPVNALQIE